MHASLPLVYLCSQYANPQRHSKERKRMVTHGHRSNVSFQLTTVTLIRLQKCRPDSLRHGRSEACVKASCMRDNISDMRPLCSCSLLCCTMPQCVVGFVRASSVRQHAALPCDVKKAVLTLHL